MARSEDECGSRLQTEEADADWNGGLAGGGWRAGGVAALREACNGDLAGTRERSSDLLLVVALLVASNLEASPLVAVSKEGICLYAFVDPCGVEDGLAFRQMVLLVQVLCVVRERVD